MKKCSRCKAEKDESCFGRYSKSNDGLKSQCKECVKVVSKIYYQENKEEIAISGAQYRKENKDKIAIHKAEYYQDNKEEKIKYYQDHKEEIAVYKAQYHKDNKEELNAISRKYYQDHKKECIAKAGVYQKERCLKDPEYKFRISFSSLFKIYLKSNNINKERNSTFKILGYTPDQIREHLYFQFDGPENLDNNGKIWMTPENQGMYEVDKWDENDSSTWKWQVDHKTPQSEFPCQSKDDPIVKICWGLDNLRPLKAKDNLLDGVNRIRHKNKRNKKL